MKDAWRDPAGDGAGPEGQAISGAITGERGCLAWVLPGNPFPSFSPLPQVMGSITHSGQSSGRPHGEGVQVSWPEMAQRHLTLVRDLSPSAVTTAPVVALT